MDFYDLSALFAFLQSDDKNSQCRHQQYRAADNGIRTIVISEVAKYIESAITGPDRNSIIAAA